MKRLGIQGLYREFYKQKKQKLNNIDKSVKPNTPP